MDSEVVERIGIIRMVGDRHVEVGQVHVIGPRGGDRMWAVDVVCRPPMGRWTEQTFPSRGEAIIFGRDHARRIQGADFTSLCPASTATRIR